MENNTNRKATHLGHILMSSFTRKLFIYLLHPFILIVVVQVQLSPFPPHHSPTPHPSMDGSGEHYAK